MNHKKETRAFLGTRFWRIRIPENRQIVSLLYLMKQKRNYFMWGLRKQQAFEQIKQEIAREVALGKSEHDVMEGTLHRSRGECKKYPGRLEESHWGTGVIGYKGYEAC